MNEKKKSSYSEDDTLLMTDDLVGRLEPENLIEKLKSSAEVEEHFYVEAEEAPPPSVPTTIAFFSHNEPAGPIIVDGTLQVLSFGEEGWRVTVDGVDPTLAVALAKRTAADPLLHAKVIDVVELAGGLDVTVHFGSLDDKCSVTVAADNGVAI
jgi:hypothetical protein